MTVRARVTSESVNPWSLEGEHDVSRGEDGDDVEELYLGQGIQGVALVLCVDPLPHTLLHLDLDRTAAAEERVVEGLQQVLYDLLGVDAVALGRKWGMNSTAELQSAWTGELPTNHTLECRDRTQEWPCHAYLVSSHALTTSVTTCLRITLAHCPAGSLRIPLK